MKNKNLLTIALMFVFVLVLGGWTLEFPEAMANAADGQMPNWETADEFYAHFYGDVTFNEITAWTTADEYYASRYGGVAFDDQMAANEPTAVYASGEFYASYYGGVSLNDAAAWNTADEYYASTYGTVTFDNQVVDNIEEQILLD